MTNGWPNKKYILSNYRPPYLFSNNGLCEHKRREMECSFTLYISHGQENTGEYNT